MAAALGGERPLVFPTLANLMRLAESDDVDSALAAAAGRPVFTVMPRVERRAGTTVIVIPAEAGYGITEHEQRR